MKHNLAKLGIIVLPLLLSGCDFINNITERKVSFEEFKEAVYKIDTKHNYVSVKVTGYTSLVDEVNETYLYDSANDEWKASADNTTATAQSSITDAATSAKQIDLSYSSSDISKYFKFYVGISNSYRIEYLNKNDELKMEFNDKYGMITKGYVKTSTESFVVTRDLTFAYSTK